MIQRRPNRSDPPVHHIAGSNNVCTCLRMAESLTTEDLNRLIIQDLEHTVFSPAHQAILPIRIVGI